MIHWLHEFSDPWLGVEYRDGKELIVIMSRDENDADRRNLLALEPDWLVKAACTLSKEFDLTLAKRRCREAGYVVRERSKWDDLFG